MLRDRPESPANTGQRIELFERTAAHHLPGTLYCFNIADFKRRNIHLGHRRGDEDVAAFDAALRLMAPKNASIARIDGARWLMLCSRNENDRVQTLLDQYHRCEPLTVGWQVEARRREAKKTARALVEADISRAVRCLCLDVDSAQTLNAAISTILENDYDLPVDRPLRLPDCADLPRQPWRCVSRYPEADPACPFCGDRSFAWTGGDGTVYSGEGTCNGCGAEISTSTIDESVVSAAQ
jgi:GGDEF domain-containing protein